ncbi:hypothetical protein TYRP_013835, partial [Tyrophagus putrescentiae]
QFGFKTAGGAKPKMTLCFRDFDLGTSKNLNAS